MRSYQGSTRALDDRPQAHALLTLSVKVSPDWIDYNGHMTEWKYYQALTEAGDNFLSAMGFTQEYVRRGYSFFSVEGHLRNLHECSVDTPLQIFTEVLGVDKVRLHIYQYVMDTTRDLVVATGEHMLLHVDINARRAAPADDFMETCLRNALAKWPAPIRPKGMSAAVGEVRDEG